MPNHLIAIIGRPNVGKSTLFNRIVGSQDAIVHDQPGVTRDRHYANAEWCGKTFTLIDTGGFVPKSEEVFEKAIREQSKIAMEEADEIIFVVDANDGITHVDREIASILRKSNKQVILAVNKIDNAASETNAAEFHSLGLGDPTPISALGGRQIGDFLDIITKNISTDGKDRSDDDRLKLAVVGKPNVGKSSLVNAIIGEERTIVTPVAGTTRDPIDTVLKHFGEEIVMIDTAGLIKKKRIRESVEFYSTVRTLKSIERCNVAVVLFDASERIEKQDLMIVQSVIERNRGAVIAVNKWDLVADKDNATAKNFEKAIRDKLRLYDYIPFVFISAKTKQRVFRVIELAKLVHAERSKRIGTSELNKMLLDDIHHYPPSTKTGKDVKLNYVTQVKSLPPIFTFFASEPALIGDNYKRYLENKIREHWGFVGVPLTLQFRRKH
ncbi:MAG TPA: ribosome biogenesis GTPase Der [Bacteroidota bacterium]|nr:ribosome biogenesis GTPase Der [Bacteroidota bacterium]